MDVISICGPCGSGKSTLINMLEDKYEFIRTVYKNCKGAELNPNSYESKIDYTKKWFDEIKTHKETGKKTLLSDRSPFDCVAYLREKQRTYVMELNEQFKDLEQKGVFTCSILVTADKEILKNRISARFSTGLRDMSIFKTEILNLNSSLKYFKSNVSNYDLIINNSNESPIETYHRILNFLS